MQDLREGDPRPRRVVRGSGGSQALLEGSPRGDGALSESPLVKKVSSLHPPEPNLGDLFVLILTSTLACMRDRLKHDGYEDAAELLADLVEISDDYITRGRG